MPVFLLIISLVDISVTIQVKKRFLQRGTGVHDQEQPGARQNRNMQRQMLFLMISSVALFLITTLPFFLYKIIFPRQAASNLQNIDSELIIKLSAVFLFFQSLNYSVSCYHLSITSTVMAIRSIFMFTPSHPNCFGHNLYK